MRNDGTAIYLLHRVCHETNDQYNPHQTHIGYFFLSELNCLLLAILEVYPVCEDKPQQKKKGDEIDDEKKTEECAK